MACETPDLSGLVCYCICPSFVTGGCPPDMRVDATLKVADRCDPPRLEGGALVLPSTQTFWPGQCVSLYPTTGTDPATYILGSGYYEIIIRDANTGAILFGPAHVDISSDNDPEECIDLTTLLAAC